MTYAFSFDAAFCSGCKACQAACKDKNNLPTGVLWRRVYEVSGGNWQQNGDAWQNTVFAYNLSISCNHCAYPKCAGVCPVDAYVLRQDGIVFLDTTKCVGCGYCAWACPYGAPQYNADVGHMTKCDFCFDQLERGLPPVCVAACPMRVLDYGEAWTEPVLPGNEMRLWETPPEAHPYPLPGYSHSQPRLVIKPHAAMNTAEEKSVANIEEIQPRVPSAWEEVPLILFTLLAQLAVGGFWAMLWIFPRMWMPAGQGITLLEVLPLLGIGLCLGVSVLASFAHLGTKRNAWRVFSHLRKSWLSREILFTILFGMGWLVTILERTIWQRGSIEWIALTATLGFGLIYSMAQVYRLTAAPGWNSWRTNAGFMVSALLLGQLLMTTLLSYELSVTGIQFPSAAWVKIGGSVIILLLSQLAIVYRRSPQPLFQYIRIGLILGGIVLSILSLVFFKYAAAWISPLIFLLAVIEEGVGRWVFYRSRL
ncbi:MAG TPA: DmsC/YnfH family molybdoenzyme membrane anchor subunit [Anaerolineales bacterium]|nr:DmsC/YnfH family molybdoenzyme membrane anchor subunit [Anaerolineales bacterium]